MADRVMILVEADEITRLRAENRALRDELKAVKITPLPDWISIKDYADRVGVTTATVRNWIRKGVLETYRHGSKTMMRTRPRR
ncbi:hypothetical protein IE00_11170 [Paracoccus sp. SM22M-07]|nr:hypothetical protein IE00_11170 [Paracoccus sp. SM22M-07]